MRPVLFRCGRVSIYSYPAMLYVGMVLGIFAQAYAAQARDLNPRRTIAATLILLVPALAGARLLFVLSHWHHYRGDLRRIWRRSEGGASMYGGLLLALPLSVPVLAVVRIPFGAFWDVASFTMLIGMIFARVGCLLNGCCCGLPTTGRVGLYLPDLHGVWTRRFPTQIFEGLWALVVLAGAIALWRVVPYSGALFLYTVATYATGRIVLESTRQEQDSLLQFRLQRMLSVAFVASSVVAFGFVWLRQLMSDWYLLGVPLVLLALVTLIVFTGCQFVFPIDEYEEENVGTTTGTGPLDFIPVDVQISAGCDATANAVHIVLTSNIPTAQSIPFTLTTLPAAGQTLSTEGMHITLDDEGQVFCTIDITPAEGEPLAPLQATHDKIKGELVTPFTLACEDGFALT